MQMHILSTKQNYLEEGLDDTDNYFVLLIWILAL